MADARRLHTICQPLQAGDEAFAPGLTAGNGNLARKRPDGTLQLCALEVHSAVLLVSHIVNSTQRFAFCLYHFEHGPSNILRLADNCALYLLLQEGGRSRQTNSVPSLLPWLVECSLDSTDGFPTLGLSSANVRAGASSVRSLAGRQELARGVAVNFKGLQFRHVLSISHNSGCFKMPYITPSNSGVPRSYFILTIKALGTFTSTVLGTPNKKFLLVIMGQSISLH